MKERPLSFHSIPADTLSGVRVESQEHVRQLYVEYLSGYFDIAGEITITERTDLRRNPPAGTEFGLRLGLSRYHKEAVLLMQKIFPASLKERKSKKGKIINIWHSTKESRIDTFDELSPRLRVKAGHVNVINDFLNAPDDFTEEEMSSLRERLRALKHNPQPDFTLGLTDPYVAGVIDAGAYIRIIPHDGKMQLVCQVSTGSPQLARQIIEDYTPLDVQKSEKVWKRGHVALYENNVANMLRRLLPHLHVYKELANLAIQFQEIHTTPIEKFAGGKDEQQQKEMEKIKLFNIEFERLRRKQPVKKAA